MAYSKIRARRSTNGRSRNSWAWRRSVRCMTVATRRLSSWAWPGTSLRSSPSQKPFLNTGSLPSSVPVGSTYCTSPHSSSSEFWIGVAVSRSTGAGPITVRTRCAMRASVESGS